MSDWWFMSMGYLIGSCAKQLKRLGAMLVMQHNVTSSLQSPMLEIHCQVKRLSVLQ
jgi:hypothetical protein